MLEEFAAVPRRKNVLQRHLSFGRCSAGDSGRSHFSFGTFGVPSPSDKKMEQDGQDLLVGRSAIDGLRIETSDNRSLLIQARAPEIARGHPVDERLTNPA